MYIQGNMIMGEIDDPINKLKIKIFFHKNIFAFDCSLLKTHLKYFYFSKNDVNEESEKWKNFSKCHLSKELIDNIKKFVKRVENCKAFI